MKTVNISVHVYWSGTGVYAHVYGGVILLYVLKGTVTGVYAIKKEGHLVHLIQCCGN